MLNWSTFLPSLESIVGSNNVPADLAAASTNLISSSSSTSTKNKPTRTSKLPEKAAAASAASAAAAATTTPKPAPPKPQQPQMTPEKVLKNLRPAVSIRQRKAKSDKRSQVNIRYFRTLRSWA